jgi:transposase
MMGEAPHRQEQLIYRFKLDGCVPAEPLLRKLGAVLDLDWLRGAHKPFYSPIGRPSVRPELKIRMLLFGCCYAIRSERRPCQEMAQGLAYR